MLCVLLGDIVCYAQKVHQNFLGGVSFSIKYAVSLQGNPAITPTIYSELFGILKTQNVLAPQNAYAF